ncbi:unnamed protein product [Closterium sp. NIES-54]
MVFWVDDMSASGSGSSAMSAWPCSLHRTLRGRLPNVRYTGQARQRAFPLRPLDPRPVTPDPGPTAPRPPLFVFGPSAPSATAATTTVASAATAAPAYRATMALLRVLAFDHEGRPVQFDTWLDDLQLYLLCDIKDGVSLFDHVGGEFSSNLVQDFCRGEGILQSFTLPDSPQRNGIAERRIGLVMEVTRTSMIHAAAPHFLWPFLVQYAAHELKLWPRVSLPETSPTLRWTREVGDASVFRVWGSRAFVHDTSADKLSPHAIPCVFLNFVPGAPGWKIYHPTSRRVFPSQDVTFYETVPFYRLFPYRCAPPPPPPLFLAPIPHPVAVGSGADRGAASGGVEPGGAESEGAEIGGAEPGGDEPEGVEPRGAALEGAESGGAEPQGAALSGGSTGAGAARAGVTGGTATTGPGGARTRGTGAAGTGGVEGGGAGDPTESGATGACGSGAGGAGAGGAGVGGPGLGGAGVREARAVDPGCTPASPLLAPSPSTEQSGGLPERREPASRPVSPVRTACRVPRSRPPPVPNTHAMTLRPSSVPLHVPLPAPAESSFREVPNPESDRSRAASPTVSLLLATAITDPSFESATASALVAELLDFAAACRLDYTTALVAESASASPPSVGGECALGTDVLEDRQEEFECLAAAVPCLGSMVLAPEGDPDAPDIPTPRSYAEAITCPYGRNDL